MNKNKKNKCSIIVLMILVILPMIFFNTIISLCANNEVTPVIADGTYAIRSSINNQYGLDVGGASQNNGANIALYEYKGYTHQKFQINYLGNGYYRIVSLHANKSLDVEGSKNANGANVEQYKINNPISKNQKWKIIKNADGTYSFISECNGLYLDVYTGAAKNGTNIQMYKGHGGKSQKFTLEAVSVIANGTYAIKSVINDKYGLDVGGASQNNGANIALYEYNNHEHQKFKITYISNGYYQITAVHSGKAIDVEGSKKTNGTNVEQYKVNQPVSSNQKWKIIKNMDGTYSFVSECNGLYLDVFAGIAKNGTNIQMYKGHGGNSQKFKLVTATTGSNSNNSNNNTTQGTQTIKDGIYSIESGVASGHVLDVEGGSRENGANIQIYDKQSANRQKFQVKYIGNGYYTITATYCNKVLDVEGSGMKNGTNVLQYTLNQPVSNNQKWMIKEAGNGYYYIISALNGLYLDLYASSTQNGNNIQLYKGHGGNSQKFKFVQPLNVVNSIDTNKYPGYKEKITKLMDAHPGWNFELLYTGLRFDQVIAGEAKVHSRNLVPKSYAGEWVCSVCGTKLYDSGWYCASEKAIAYYMDTRNYLDETNVFQFQDLNEYIKNVCTLSGIQSQVNGTFLQNYASAIDNACRNQNVNSYYIITRVLQEQGRNGTTIGKGMDGGNGKTYYNPFNIGASGNGYSQIYANALATAKNNGWDTMQKALEGGITFCKKNWLENYQNTLYQNKFDIDTRNGTALYEHQYMQNLMAAYNEARTLRNMYANTGKLDSNFTFIIPIYEKMSSTIAQTPSHTQEIAPINVQVTANSGVYIRKEASESSEALTLVPSQTIVLSVERGINSNWHKVITTKGTIGYMSGTYIKQVNDVTNCHYTAKVKTADGSGCNVRIGPSTSLSVLTAISDGTAVTVINQGTYNGINGYNWYRVRLSDGRQGFMPSNFLVK